jgi:DNA-binding transcriptional LysR family regulator
VEPTEAGLRLYASAQRLLQAEEQLIEELESDDEGVVTGTLELGASTGPGGSVVPVLLCEFQERHPDVRVRLSVSDTQRIVEQVGERELELGIVGAGRRHRGVTFEPFFRDEVVLVVPASHPFAGKTITLEQLRGEPLITMQEGAGVRQVIEDELRKSGTRLRDLDVRLELGLQESVRSAVLAGHGITFISRLAIESDLSTGLLATARVRGFDPVREIFLARASGRSETRAARAFVAFARERVPA